MNDAWVLKPKWFLERRHVLVGGVEMASSNGPCMNGQDCGCLLLKGRVGPVRLREVSGQ